VFWIVDCVLLKPLAYRESHRLVAVKETWKQIADRVPVLEGLGRPAGRSCDPAAALRQD
jgi:hypothetical protein